MFNEWPYAYAYSGIPLKLWRHGDVRLSVSRRHPQHTSTLDTGSRTNKYTSRNSFSRNSVSRQSFSRHSFSRHSLNRLSFTGNADNKSAASTGPQRVFNLYKKGSGNQVIPEAMPDASSSASTDVAEGGGAASPAPAAATTGTTPEGPSCKQSRGGCMARLPPLQR